MVVVEEMTQALTVVKPRWRTQIPKEHRGSIDMRVQWLWNQRFGTVQSVLQRSDDVLDQLAATMIIAAILGRDLASIQLIFQRLEGGAQEDSADVLEPPDTPLVF